MIGEDGHTTDCTYYKCAHPESLHPCPFGRETPQTRMLTVDDLVGCKHEWRHIDDLKLKDGHASRFHCIHCLQIEVKTY